jgi:DNA-binding NarL/FixJ family response regulator
MNAQATPAASAAAIRVLIVDDHAIVRVGLAMLLNGDGGVTVVGDCGGLAEACALAASTQPDVILLDCDLGDEDGIEGIPALLEAAPLAAVLLFTAVADKEVHRQALQLGARGVVTKHNSAATLLKAVRRVHAGEIWAERADIGQVLTSLRANNAHIRGEDTQRIELLSQRERDIITLVAEGLDNVEIGTRLNISEKTVRNHLTSIFDKLCVPDRLGLAVYAFREGLAKLPTRKSCPPGRGD